MQEQQPREELTPREQEIYNLLLAGATPKEIAYTLKITHNTVVTHQKSIYRKLGVHNINEFLLKCKPERSSQTYDEIRLRATIWNNPETFSSGYHWGSSYDILAKNFPITKWQAGSDGRFTVKISGTADKDLPNVKVDIYGICDDNKWEMIACSDDYQPIQAQVPFELKYNIHIFDNYDSVFDFSAYKDVAFQVTYAISFKDEKHPFMNFCYGSIPEGIRHLQTMATISNFKIEL